MESLVGKRYQYSGKKIGHITIITEPRAGYLLGKDGKPKDNKTCLVECSCGNRYELLLKAISNNYTSRCKYCGKCHGVPPSKSRVKSLFEYWMRQWVPETHKPCTLKLPYFSGGVGEEYIKGWCYVDKETYDHCSKVMCIKPKHYVMYNHTKDNTYRLGAEYLGNRKVWFFIHRLAGNIPEDFMGDHIKGFKLDNRGYNIRVASPLQNNHNNKVVKNKHKYKGLKYHSKKSKPWIAQLMINRKSHSKAFTLKECAIEYRDCFSLYIQGEFAYLNYEDKRNYYKTIMLSLLTKKHLVLKVCPS